ncbi:MAG: hypothetical protein V4858_19250 [Pseudomonadota bacterium]
MKPNLRHAWACLALMCLHGLAAAEVPVATAEALMRKSGIWSQLADLAVQVKGGMAQASQDGSLPPQDLKRLEQVAEDAFAANRLRDTALQVLTRDVTPAQSVDALKWFDSPTGRQITAMEEAFSANFDDMNRVMADGNKALAQASSRRQSLLSQIVKASRAAEAMATMEINITVAILQGVANAMPHSTKGSAKDLRKAFAAQRPQMVAANVGVALSMSAVTYQAASDKMLEQYVKFLSSKSGVALSISMMDALDQSLSHAAQRLGSGIPKVPGTTSL